MSVLPAAPSPSFVPHRDPDGVAYHSLQCICGSRRTKRMGERLYQCQTCMTTNMLFCGAEGVFTMPVATGLEMDRERKGDVTCPSL